MRQRWWSNIKKLWCKLHGHKLVYEEWPESPLYLGLVHCQKCRITHMVIDRVRNEVI